MRYLVPLFAAVLLISISHPAAAQPAPAAEFKIQEIDNSLSIGYGIVIANLNDDDKPDIVVADSDRVIWFENPSWKLQTIIKNSEAGIATDNVCLDVYDIDGDGNLDIALGADWQPNNTTGGGSLQWLKQPVAGTNKPWQVFPIAASIPTLHRVHFKDLDGDGGAELYVGPLRGPGSTAEKNWMDAAVPLIRYVIPNSPASRADVKWEPEVLNDTDFHVMHNFLPLRDEYWGGGVFTASYEGLNFVTQAEDGKWSVRQIGSGNQQNRAGVRGSSEVRRGKIADGKIQIFATIDPFHGNQVVVYTQPTREGVVQAGAANLWPRTVLDESLSGGHAVFCADFDNDGNDEVVAGWRDGPKTGINIYKLARLGKEDGAQDAAPLPGEAEYTWEKHALDDGIACEDLFCADLNNDGLIDIAACGRATKNVRIYWNQGKGK